VAGDPPKTMLASQRFPDPVQACRESEGLAGDEKKGVTRSDKERLEKTGNRRETAEEMKEKGGDGG